MSEMLGTSIGEVQSYHLTEPSEFLSRKHSVLFCACQLDTVHNSVTLLIRLCIKEEKTTGKRNNWNKSSSVEHYLDSRSLVLNWMRFFFLQYQRKHCLSSRKKHRLCLIAPLFSQHLLSSSVATTPFQVS